jgi:hypothetical protein
MPYRRLPNTDAARLKALQTAFNKGRELPPFQLAFTQSTYQKVQSFLPSFEKAMLESKHSYEKQVEKNKEYVKVLKKAKLYISHFIQVVNLAILRGDLPPSERQFFDLEEDERKTPSLNTEGEIIDWGNKIIKGEDMRKASVRSPITNPTIAVVRVRYEQFLDAYKFQKTLQKNYQRAQENLSNLRSNADSIILNVWNEVEAHFEDLPDNEKRDKAENYGLIYVFRKNEISKISDFVKDIIDS